MITCCLKYIKMELGYFHNKNSQSPLTPYRLLNMRATNSGNMQCTMGMIQDGKQERT